MDPCATMKVAALQMISGDSVNDNLARVRHGLSQAKALGVELLLLPENFACLASRAIYQRIGQQERTMDGPIRRFLAEAAADYQIYLVAGNVPIADAPDPNRLYSAMLVYGPDGQQVARYNKIHLFDVDIGDAKARYRESESFYPGDQVVVIETPRVRIGLSICYDLRFPELFRQLADGGAELLLMPAAFTALTGAAHWMTLLRARAIENQCFLLAANQGGVHSETRSSYGHSCFISPWGEVLEQATYGEELVIGSFDRRRVEEVRVQMPQHRHQRLLGIRFTGTRFQTK